MPARNDAQALPIAVRCCLQQQPAGVDEIVIAAGPSHDGTETLARQLANEYAAVRVVDNPTGKTPAGLNLAIQASTGDVVVRVDARSKLPVDYVANALETMLDTGAANVGAVQRPVGDTPTQRSIAAAMRSWFGSGGPAYRSGTTRRKVDTAYLGVFNRDALLEVGGFDEGFIRNQDAELNQRLKRAGHEIWLDPRLVVDYRPRASLRTLASQYWQYGWWRRRTSLRHRGSLRLRQLLPPVFVAGLVMATVASLWQPWSLVVPVGYLLSTLAIGLTASGLSVGERIGMAAALVTMHFSWAAGFISCSVQQLFGIGGDLGG